MLRKKNKLRNVECVGVPGAGKTYLTEILVKQHGWKTPPAYPSKRHGILFMLQHPIFSTIWVFTLCVETTWTSTYQLFRFKIAVFLNTAARLHVVYKRGQGVRWVVDEGLWQRVLTLYERKVTKDTFAAWVPFMPTTHAYVFLKPSEYSQQRKLGTWRKALGEGYAQKWLSTIDHNGREMEQLFLDKTKGKQYCLYNGDTAQIITMQA